MRKKKTPEELAKEAEMEEEDEFTSKRHVMCIHVLLLLFFHTLAHIFYTCLRVSPKNRKRTLKCRRPAILLVTRVWGEFAQL